jgi:transposase-like protein
MSTKHKRYSSAFKVKVAVEAIRGVKTTAQLASEH